MKTYTEWLLQHIFPCFYVSNHVSFYSERSCDSRFVTDLALYRGSLLVFIFLGAGRKDSRSVAYFTLLSTGLKKKTRVSYVKNN